jgi:hypothetical protein
VDIVIIIYGKQGKKGRGFVVSKLREMVIFEVGEE